MLCTNAIGYMLQYYMHMEIKQNKTKERKNGNKNNNQPTLFMNYIYIDILMYDLISVY